MKLLIDTPAYWTNEQEWRQKSWIYWRSIEHHGIPQEIIKPYGLGAACYPGLAVMRVAGQLAFLKKHVADYTHVLFSDSWDVFFLAGLPEILEKYKRLNSPPFLVAASKYCGNITDPDLITGLYDESTPYRYMDWAMYLAEVPEVIRVFSQLDKSCTHDESIAFATAWKEGWFRPLIDKKCEIFQHEADEHCTVDDVRKRLYNSYTQSEPCLLHFGGGYTDPTTGKDERLLPWAQRLQIV